MTAAGLRVLLVGPLPPPAGGMANQTRQLQRLLEQEGVHVSIVQTNPPYRPGWVGRVRGLRAMFRLVPYVVHLAGAAGRADVVHVMANSGWAWHLFAAPAVWIACLRRKPVVVNYRGGLAEKFLHARASVVRRTLSRASALIVPSGFLKEVFARYGMRAEVIPNIVDENRFCPGARAAGSMAKGPHIVVGRNLEHLYGNDVAIRALARLRQQYPSARLTMAGSGPEADALRSLAEELGVTDAVSFSGRLDPDQMAELYRSADVTLNPSRADNTPNSILESLACGVPVVTTNVGGIPFLVEHGRTAWLVRPDEPEAAAAGIAQVVEHAELRKELTTQGLALARSCAWDVVRDQWLTQYRALSGRGSHGRVTMTPVS